MGEMDPLSAFFAGMLVMIWITGVFLWLLLLEQGLLKRKWLALATLPWLWPCWLMGVDLTLRSRTGSET